MKYPDLKHAADADRLKQKLVNKLLSKKSTNADRMQLLSFSIEELQKQAGSVKIKKSDS